MESSAFVPERRISDRAALIWPGNSGGGRVSTVPSMIPAILCPLISK